MGCSELWNTYLSFKYRGNLLDVSQVRCLIRHCINQNTNIILVAVLKNSFSNRRFWTFKIRVNFFCVALCVFSFKLALPRILDSLIFDFSVKKGVKIFLILCPWIMKLNDWIHAIVVEKKTPQSLISSATEMFRLYQDWTLRKSPLEIAFYLTEN